VIYTREEAHAVVRRMMMSLDDKYSMWLPADEYRKATSKPTEGMRPRRQFSWVGRIPTNCDRVRLLAYRNHAMESPACVAPDGIGEIAPLGRRGSGAAVHGRAA